MIWQIWYLVPNVQFSNVTLTSTLFFAHAASHDDIVEIPNQVFCLTPPFIGSLDDFFGFSMKNFFTTLSSFLLILAKALSQFSLLYHISEVFRNVSSYLFDNHFRCQKIIYIIFYTLYEQPWTMMRDGGGVCLFSFIVCRLLLQMSQLSCNGYRRFQFFGMLSFICFFLFSTVFWLIPFFS